MRESERVKQREKERERQLAALNPAGCLSVKATPTAKLSDLNIPLPEVGSQLSAFGVQGPAAVSHTLQTCIFAVTQLETAA